MKIAVDVMGTDYGPAEIIKGVLQAVAEYGCDVVLVGDQDVIRGELAKEHQENNPKVTIHHASQVIEMKDHPGISVRKKKDASIVVATRLLREKECDALISSGSTGAAVASALFGLGRIPGIERPAIATVIPNLKGATVLVDSGAVVDAKPEVLVQSAIMGSVYAELQLGLKEPRVGLLNIGEEETKGNEQCLATYPLLKKDPHINFIGNVEGRDINKGTVDVVVCDGFVGNVVLKSMEGLAKALMQMVKETLMDSGLLTKLGALLVKSALSKLGRRIDVSEYGGALLMGVKAPFIICHGNSKAKDIKSALRVAKELTEKDVVGRIRKEIIHDEESGEL
ncbi:MAG: phosphate acyltransferase PlsX [Acidaminococcus sp.]|jgi:glycerol-3-phosphate acyltransferase PlsX|uniref:phosphate acyltransferase PlsX n=1 Tax=Acidaminococcus sp. TaxID=1872103 RepID=UPI003F168773|nr:phosphate acyltransferase PlsX [Acidaminococcus sp.]